MSPKEIADIIMKTVFVSPTWSQRLLTEVAAERIASLVQASAKAAARKPLPAPPLPSRSCDCGASRINSNKHATWCSVVNPKAWRR